MGRKSLADERREAILAAFERCIGRYGIEVPLEQIADEAGVKRSLIRHYLGNREELVNQVIERIAEAYPRRTVDILGRALERGVEGVLDALFPDPATRASWEPDAFNHWDAVITAVASTAQGRYPQAKERVARMMTELVAYGAAELGRLFPHATPEARYQVTYSLLCLVQSNESLLLLGIDEAHTALARASARRLLAALAEAG